MPIYATAGAKLYIGQALPAESGDMVVSDFVGQSWVNIRWLETLGEVGDESAEITFDAIGESRTQKLKGVRNAGTMAVVAGIDYTDPGQEAVRNAEKSPNDYAFRLEFNDEPTVTGVPSYRYFCAKVMSVREVLDTANNVMKMNMSLGVNSNVVKANAHT